MAGDMDLRIAEKFCCLGSILSSDANIDNDISAHTARASQSFGRLSRRSRYSAKVAVGLYKAAILTSFLYGSESWVLYRRHIREIDHFHVRCLRRIAHIKWQDKNRTPNYCSFATSGIEAFLMTAQLHWTGHVVCMEDSRLHNLQWTSRRSSFTWWSEETLQGRPEKQPEKMWHAAWRTWSAIAADRSEWRCRCYESIQQFEVDRAHAAEDKRTSRKPEQDYSRPVSSHLRAHHLRWRDPSCWRLSPSLHCTVIRLVI